MQGDAVHDRAHAELAHAVEHVVAGGVFGGHALAALPQGQVGSRPGRPSRRGIPAAAGRRRSARSGWPCGWRWSRPSRRTFLDIGSGLLGEIGRQLTGHAALELGSQLRIGGGVGGEALRSSRLRRRHRQPWRPTRRRCRPGFRTGHGSSPGRRGSGRFRRCPAARRGTLPCPACSANRKPMVVLQQIRVG